MSAERYFLIMSMGMGNITVEFFSAEIPLRVWDKITVIINIMTGFSFQSNVNWKVLKEITNICYLFSSRFYFVKTMNKHFAHFILWNSNIQKNAAKLPKLQNLINAKLTTKYLHSYFLLLNLVGQIWGHFDPQKSRA